MTAFPEAGESGRPMQPNSWYPTPAEAVQPLLRWLPAEMQYQEPCAGDGALLRALHAAGHRCDWAADIAPRDDGIHRMDARELIRTDLPIITNPPYSPRALMHDLLDLWLAARVECWLLIDLDWAANVSAAQYLRHCDKIIAVGRMKIFAGTAAHGRSNYGWFHFPASPDCGPPVFIPRNYREGP